jgi:hypothetical protein
VSQSSEFAAITLCAASQRVFIVIIVIIIVVLVIVYFVIDSVRKLFDTLSYTHTHIYLYMYIFHLTVMASKSLICVLRTVYDI